MTRRLTAIARRLSRRHDTAVHVPCSEYPAPVRPVDMTPAQGRTELSRLLDQSAVTWSH